MNKQPFPEWWNSFRSIAGEQGVVVSNDPDEYRAFYDMGLSAEEAVSEEVEAQAALLQDSLDGDESFN